MNTRSNKELTIVCRKRHDCDVEALNPRDSLRGLDETKKDESERPRSLQVSFRYCIQMTRNDSVFGSNLTPIVAITDKIGSNLDTRLKDGQVCVNFKAAIPIDREYF